MKSPITLPLLCVLSALTPACNQCWSPGGNPGPCQADDDADDDTVADDDTAPDDDTTTDDDTVGDDDSVPTFAARSGTVTRPTAPSVDGVGPLYVVVLDDNPLINPGTAQRGFTLISGADMTDGAAPIPYAIADVPTRPQPYFVLAFLDDDESASTIYPTPGSGDLVGYVSNPLPGPPTVDLSVEGDQVLNIVLNVAMP